MINPTSRYQMLVQTVYFFFRARYKVYHKCRSTRFLVMGTSVPYTEIFCKN